MENRENSRCNNFNMLRFIAAIMVMVGHMAYIDGSNNIPIIWGQGIQSVGVKIFFLIGGYLITKSWLSDSHPIRYGVKRIFRIFPPLIVFVLLVVFVFGPVLSSLSLKEYFLNFSTYRYLLNILLFPIYNLPGVFAENPYAYAVNGSLWTLPVEMTMYLVIPIIIMFSGKKEKALKTYSIITCIVCMFQVLHLYIFPSWRLVIWGTDLGQAWTLIPYYFLGALFTFDEVKRLLNLQKAMVFAAIFVCISPYLNSAINELVMYGVFSYLIFSFALDEKPYFDNMFIKCEFSYGIYLYGFFVQQVVLNIFMRLGIRLQTIGYLVISCALTFVLAILSYRFIEQPFIKLSKKIIKSIPVR